MGLGSCCQPIPAHSTPARKPKTGLTLRTERTTSCGYYLRRGASRCGSAVAVLPAAPTIGRHGHVRSAFRRSVGVRPSPAPRGERELRGRSRNARWSARSPARTYDLARSGRSCMIGSPGGNGAPHRQYPGTTERLLCCINRQLPRERDAAPAERASGVRRRSRARPNIQARHRVDNLSGLQ